MQINGLRRNAFYCALVVTFLISVPIGCSPQSESPRQAATPDSKTTLLSPRGFGPYQVGTSTQDEILGPDDRVGRDRFAKEGILFEFDRGVELTGIVVMSGQYSLENGLKVGSTRRSVIGLMGEPLNGDGVVKNEKLVLDLLIYPNFSFLIDDTGHVFAIRLGESG